MTKPRPTWVGNAIRQSIKARGLWGGISIALLLAKIFTKKWFGEHHRAVTKVSMLWMLGASCYCTYWALSFPWNIQTGWNLAGVTLLFVFALTCIIIPLSYFAVSRAYRRVILMKTIQFAVFGAIAAGFGFAGHDAWMRLYARQPAAATLLGLIIAVVLYGLRDVIAVFARAMLVKSMAVIDLEELPSLSPEGRYRAAIHEAGHALCYGLCEGIPEDAFVVIEQDMNELIGGRVNLPEPREPTDFTRLHVEWMMLMVLAGVAAEEVIFGDGSMLGGGDMEAFSALAVPYLMAGHADVYAMKPETELDVLANRAIIAKVREEYRCYAKSFIQSNRSLVESIARDLCAMEFLDCEGIANRVEQVCRPQDYILVKWPESLPLLITETH